MNWLFDAGNTRIKCAALQPNGTAGPMQAFEHAALATALPAALAPGARAWVASVAGETRTAALIDALQARGVAVERVHSRARCGRLRIAYAEPARLGVDRFLALLAASERTDGPWLLVSVGSALTVDALAADGEHLGGLISIAPLHQREALAARFPVLPATGGDVRDFAADTADALASGARAAAAGVVEHALRAATRRFGVAPTVLLGGGAAEALGPFDARVVPAPQLVLDGLARLASSAEA